MNRFVKLRGPYSFVFICYRDLEPVKSLRQQFMTFQQGNLILHGICNCENCPNQLMDMNRVVYPVPFVSPDERVLIQAAVWSPRSNALVYCRQNDIYYIPDVTIDQTERLTSDGSFNAISNGIPDWTYRGKSNKLEPKCAYEVITFFLGISDCLLSSRQKCPTNQHSGSRKLGIDCRTLRSTIPLCPNSDFQSIANQIHLNYILSKLSFATQR